MKRWFMRLALLTSAVWAFLAVASLYSLYLARGTPDWYALPAPDTAQQQADAIQSDQLVADLFSYASDVAAAQRRRYLARQRQLPSSRPADIIGPKTVHFTQRQINAFADKWQQALFSGNGPAAASESGQALGRYVRGARVALSGGSLLIAAQLEQVGILNNSIATAEFRPSLGDAGNGGELRLTPDLYRIYSGRLPIPDFLWSSARTKIADAVRDAQRDWSPYSHIGPDGLANRYAAATAATGLLLAALDDSSADAVILLPCNVGGLHSSVPVMLTELKIADRQLTATFRPLTDGERAALLTPSGNP